MQQDQLPNQDRAIGHQVHSGPASHRTPGKHHAWGQQCSSPAAGDTHDRQGRVGKGMRRLPALQQTVQASTQRYDKTQQSSFPSPTNSAVQACAEATEPGRAPTSCPGKACMLGKIASDSPTEQRGPGDELRPGREPPPDTAGPWGPGTLAWGAAWCCISMGAAWGCSSRGAWCCISMGGTWCCISMGAAWGCGSRGGWGCAKRLSSRAQVSGATVTRAPSSITLLLRSADIPAVAAKQWV